MSMAYITMEWRGQQHAREAVESTASSATSTIQITSLSAAWMKKNMEEFIPDWRVDQSSQRISVFQYTTRVEGSSYSSVMKSNRQQQQVPSIYPSIYQAGYSPQTPTTAYSPQYPVTT